MASLETRDDDNLSVLSFSSDDSIDEMKFQTKGQYTCDECGSIPEIINIDSTTKNIMLKCENHGLKEININTYLHSCLNFNSQNWKCSQCDNIQREKEENFIYCECGAIFCESCIRVHQTKNSHKNTILSEKFYMKCKKSKEHFEEDYKGYCQECKIHFCKKCEGEHKWHETISINEMIKKKEEINKIKELNKEYKKLISFYESLIKLNELLIYSFNNSKYNYYNLTNINTVINNIDGNHLIYTLNKSEEKAIVPGKKNENLYTYMNKLYKTDIKEQTDRVQINNKYFNNFDLKVLTQLPLKNLRLLILENNCISKIDCLENSEFKNLIILNLNGNSIKDISILENDKFKDIQALFFRNNSIKDVAIFGKKKFESLRQLDLRNNLIEDIIHFERWKENMKSLQSLYLTNNAFDPKNFESTIEKIKELMETDV